MKEVNIKSIGVFDSGVGGLDILKELVKAMPQYDYTYLADTARFPYGPRSQELIYDFVLQAVDFLFSQNCPLIILACNTASAEALRKIQQGYLLEKYRGRRVLGVIIPAAEKSCELSSKKRVGVLATEGTVNSEAFVREIKKLDNRIEIFQSPCPLLAPIIEAGEANSQIADMALKQYIQPLLEKDIDTLILGCTHYGLLADKIKSMIGSKVKLIAEGEVVSEKLQDYLVRHQEIAGQISRGGERVFLATDLTNNFQKLSRQFFGCSIEPIKISFS